MQKLQLETSGAIRWIKKQQSGGDVSEDQFRYFSDEVQKITDSHTKDIDELLIQKEKDIMQV